MPLSLKNLLLSQNLMTLVLVFHGCMVYSCPKIRILILQTFMDSDSRRLRSINLRRFFFLSFTWTNDSVHRSLLEIVAQTYYIAAPNGKAEELARHGTTAGCHGRYILPKLFQKQRWLLSPQVARDRGDPPASQTQWVSSDRARRDGGDVFT